MKLTILMALLIGALGGGVAGGSLVLFWNQPEPAPSVEAERQAKQKSKQEPELDEDENDVEDSDEPLTGRVRSLERRVSLLTLTAQRGGLGSGEEGQVPGEEDLSMADVADPVFEAAVLDILERDGERKDEEREAHRVELRTKRSASFASELGKRLEIGSAEQERIAQVVSDYFQEMQNMRSDSAEDRPATRKEWRERMDALRQKADSSLAEILDADQMKAYQELDEDEKIGFGRGQGRGGTREGQRAREEAKSD